MEPHLYATYREQLDAAISTICRRFRLSRADAEDFAGEFRLRLVREDYAVLRQFEGRSALTTYLHVVVMRAFQDWRNAQWGKWRTSAEAKRLGPIAERLEILIVRDGYSLDEAAEMLVTNFGFDVDRASLVAIAVRFPQRHRRRAVAESDLAHIPSPAASPDAELSRAEASVLARQAADVLARAVAALPAEDQLILRMRFKDSFAVVEIARVLHLDQKSLYRRIDRLLAGLRAALERDGVTRDVAADALAMDGFSALDTAQPVPSHTGSRRIGDAT